MQLEKCVPETQHVNGTVQQWGSCSTGLRRNAKAVAYRPGAGGKFCGHLTAAQLTEGVR